MCIGGITSPAVELVMLHGYLLLMLQGHLHSTNALWPYKSLAKVTFPKQHLT